MELIAITPITSSSAEYAAVFALRDEILRKPLGMSLKDDDLSRDHTDVILVGKLADEVIACLMLHHKDNDLLQLRQMAVYTSWQGRGIGKQLVQGAEKYAVEKGYKKMILHARKEALGFYQTMKYKVIGDQFVEVGIPHYMMEKNLVD